MWLIGLASVVQAAADPLEAGRRLYLEGVLPSGLLLQGVGPAGVVLAGAPAACVTCHRRSGYGSSEGPIEVRAITGPALFGHRVAPEAPGSRPDTVRGTVDVPPRERSPAQAARARAESLRDLRATVFAGNRPRPAYEDAVLARAILEGVDVTGQSMNAAMPRYPLEPAVMASLTAYLKTLSDQVAPGVTEDTVHFATVIQPGTDPETRRALIEVLQTFLKDRNLGLRAESRREQAGFVRLQRKYREWVLHVWDLTGAGDTWGAQLEARYEKQPVFAMMSGLGQAPWRPIHEFCERFKVPCIFPQTGLPVLSATDFYTVYLSRGVTLEAQVLARHLRDLGERGPLTQVYRRSGASATAAAAFRQAWAEGGGAALSDLALEDPPGEASRAAIARHGAVGTWVMWLSPDDVAEVRAFISAPDPAVKAVYLSAALVGEDLLEPLPVERDGRVRLIYPQDLPVARAARLAVVKRWMANNDLPLSNETVQMNAYLAATVTAMIVTRSMDTYSREFLIERIEHRLGTALELSIYPHLSLGPGQRYASKGSYVVRFGGNDGGGRQLTPVSDWIVP